MFRCCSAASANTTGCPTARIKIGTHPGNYISANVTPDTGAEFSVAPPKLLEDLGVDINNTRWPTGDELVGPTGEPLAMIG